LCICHIRAAKQIVKGTLQEAEDAMPVQGKLFEALQRHALAVGALQRDVTMAVDEADMRTILEAALQDSNKHRSLAVTNQTAQTASASPVDVEFVGVPASTVAELYDVKAVQQFLTAQSSEVTGQSGRRVLCEVIGCPFANSSHSAHQQFWVAQLMPRDQSRSTMMLFPLSSVNLPEPPDTSEADEAFYADAREKAEVIRRTRAANMIRRWWFWLWGDDIVWTAYTARVAESDKGQELVQSLIKSAKPAALSPSPTLTSSAPWFTGTVQGSKDFLGALDTSFL